MREEPDVWPLAVLGVLMSLAGPNLAAASDAVAAAVRQAAEVVWTMAIAVLGCL